jgi:6-pyruvoyltetrahydropterin/6-carboxytetrahydropterin synthase
VPDGHPCQRLHGHTFTVTLVLRGNTSVEQGWVMDYADISAAWEPVRLLLDHRYLNDVRGLENPTSEMLAVWIWKALHGALPLLASVEIRESGGFRCKYLGPA